MVPAVLPIWEIFLDLHDTRRYDMGHPLGISYGEIQDCYRGLGMRLEPFHVKVIRALDRAYRADRANAPKQQSIRAANG